MRKPLGELDGIVAQRRGRLSKILSLFGAHVMWLFLTLQILIKHAQVLGWTQQMLYAKIGPEMRLSSLGGAQDSHNVQVKT